MNNMVNLRESHDSCTQLGDVEKASPSVTVRGSGDTNHAHEERGAIHWQTGFRLRFPWLGLSAIIMMLLCIASTGLILGTSDGKAQQEWPSPAPMEWKSNYWKAKAQIPPNVLLALVNTVTNISLAIAIGKGVPIAWWRRAMKGSTVEDLHRSWNYSFSVLELLTAGKKFNTIALAALMAKLVLIDNVFLQKATESSPGWYAQKHTTVRLPIVKELPENYAGVFTSNGTSYSSTLAFAWDIYYFTDDLVIQTEDIYKNSTDDEDGNDYGYDTQCRGICYAAFEGFGFNWTCADDELSTEYSITPELAFENSQDQLAKKLKEIQFSGNGDTITPETFFNTTLQRNPPLAIEAQFIPSNTQVGSAKWNIPPPQSISSKTYDYGSIALQIKWAEYKDIHEKDTECFGQTKYRYCSLRPATLNYPVKIVNVTGSSKDTVGSGMKNGISLWPNWTTTADSSGPPVNGQFDGTYVVESMYDTKWDSNLLAITDFIQSSYGAFALFESTNSTGSDQIYAINYRANDLLNLTSGFFGSWWPSWDTGAYCRGYSDDPSYRIGTDINNLLLRSSMRAATKWQSAEVSEADLWTLSSVEPQIYSNFTWISSLYYKTNWWFGGAAMINTVLCALCVLPTYWGFWELGRKVTLGPMEIASAFQSPVLVNPTISSNGAVEQLVRDIGGRSVRYGEIQGQHILGVAESSIVRPLPTSRVVSH